MVGFCEMYDSHLPPYSYWITEIQVERPVTLKKEGIQTRNRKLSSKSKKSKRRGAGGAATGGMVDFFRTGLESTYGPFSGSMGRFPLLEDAMNLTRPWCLISDGWRSGLVTLLICCITSWPVKPSASGMSSHSLGSSMSSYYPQMGGVPMAHQYQGLRKL